MNFATLLERKPFYLTLDEMGLCELDPQEMVVLVRKVLDYYPDQRNRLLTIFTRVLLEGLWIDLDEKAGVIVGDLDERRAHLRACCQTMDRLMSRKPGLGNVSDRMVLTALSFRYVADGAATFDFMKDECPAAFGSWDGFVKYL